MVSEWTPNEVALFLGFLGLNDYQDHFIREDISGEVFLELTESDIRELGIKCNTHKLVKTILVLKKCKRFSTFIASAYFDIALDDTETTYDGM